MLKNQVGEQDHAAESIAKLPHLPRNSSGHAGGFSEILLKEGFY
jgi:hypothetical protein